MIHRTMTRVRYAETDQMGVVYYANYFVWMEMGRSALCKEFGFTYKEMEEKGYMLPVVKAFAKYIKPCYYEDEIVIEAAVTSLSRAGMTFGHKIYRGHNELVSEGFTEHACVSKETSRIIAIPDFYKEKIRIPENYQDYIVKL